MEKERNDVERNLIAFKKDNVALFHQLAEFKMIAEKIKKKEKEIKDNLMKQMEEYGITSFSNDELSITYVGSSVQTTLDVNTFKEKEPQLYEDLMKDYGKSTERSAYIKFIVKSK